MSWGTAPESSHFAVGMGTWRFPHHYGHSAASTRDALPLTLCSANTAGLRLPELDFPYVSSPFTSAPSSTCQSGHKVLPPIPTVNLSLLRQLWETACL